MNRKIASMIIIPLLFFAAPLLFAQTEGINEITKIQFKKTDRQIEVLIAYKGDVSYESFPVSNPNRLVLDFTKVTKISANQLIEINDAGITKITASPYKTDTARVVFYFLSETPLFKIKKTDKTILVLFPKKEVEEAIKPEEQMEPKKEVEEDNEKLKKVTIGLSSGYFALRDSLFKDIYGEGGVFLREELSYILPINVKNIELWTSVSHFQKTGKSTYYQEDLKIKFTTFSFAFRYLRMMSDFAPFVGLGIDYVSFKETYPDNFSIPSVGGSDLGYHFQVGVYYKFLPSLSTKLNIKYNIAKTQENDLTVNLGGIEYALSLNYHFNL